MYITAIALFVLGAAAAVILFVIGASAFAIAAVSAALVFGAGVCKLVASADDVYSVGPRASFRLSRR